jgi:hypothetical protein
MPPSRGNADTGAAASIWCLPAGIAAAIVIRVRSAGRRPGLLLPGPDRRPPCRPALRPPGAVAPRLAACPGPASRVPVPRARDAAVICLRLPGRRRLRPHRAEAPAGPGRRDPGRELAVFRARISRRPWEHSRVPEAIAGRRVKKGPGNTVPLASAVHRGGPRGCPPMNDPGNSPIPLSPVPGPPGLGAPLSVWAATPVTEAAQAVTAFSRRAQQDARTSAAAGTSRPLPRTRPRCSPRSRPPQSSGTPGPVILSSTRYAGSGPPWSRVCTWAATLPGSSTRPGRRRSPPRTSPTPARPRGAAGRARVTCGDARSLPALLAGRAGKTALHLQGR